MAKRAKSPPKKVRQEKVRAALVKPPKKAPPPEPARPTVSWGDLSKQAAENLKDYRRQLEKQINSEYDQRKWEEVRRLAHEKKLQGVVLVDIPRDEELR